MNYFVKLKLTSHSAFLSVLQFHSHESVLSLSTLKWSVLNIIKLFFTYTLKFEHYPTTSVKCNKVFHKGKTSIKWSFMKSVEVQYVL